MRPLFEIPTRGGRENDAQLAQIANKKSKTPTTTVRGGGGIYSKIKAIEDVVNRHLSKFANETELIRDEGGLINYIDECIKNGIVAIDTETTGLNPLLDDIVGFSMYTPNRFPCYVPLNHKSYITLERSNNQLSVEFAKEQLQRLVDGNVKIVMFNANFDIRVIKNQVGVYLPCWWDAHLATRLLNENEETNALKKLHQKYVLDFKEDAFKFDELFKGVTFDIVPIAVGYLYAAHDAIITYELYKFQEEYLGDNASEYGLQDVAWVFRNIEMPIIDVVVAMEDIGVDFDKEYNKQLSIEYNRKLSDKMDVIYNLIDEYSDKIINYRSLHPSEKLDDPINIGSPNQLKILLYEIIGLNPVDKKGNPIRSTGEEVLSSLDHPLCKAILDYRALSKLVSTYIDNLPTFVNPNDGRIHGSYKQYGADTGRFSSNEPKIYWACA